MKFIEKMDGATVSMLILFLLISLLCLYAGYRALFHRKVSLLYMPLNFLDGFKDKHDKPASKIEAYIGGILAILIGLYFLYLSVKGFLIK